MDRRDHANNDERDNGSVSEAEEPLGAPLLQNNFTSTSTGSMELVGVRGRKPVRVTEFESQFRQPEEKSTLVELVRETVQKQVAKFSLKKSVVSNVPLLRSLGSYKVLQDLPSDVVAGLTSGIMMIPQGLAFASLSTLDPIIGLYISLFSSITYVLLGTGQQTSFGCIAILSIMMGSILDRYEIKLRGNTFGTACEGAVLMPETTTESSLFNSTTFGSLVTVINNFTDTVNNTTSPMSNGTDPLVMELAEKKLQLAGSVTLLCGIIFIILGKIGFGKVTVFMSDALVTGVTVGAAFHVGSSQLNTMFGLKLPRYNGVFKLMKLWYNILINVHRSNLACIIASAICILLIYVVKKFVNEKYKDKLRVPIPIELFVMILATIISYYASLKENFQIGIVGPVPVGIPTPRFPDPSLGVDYLTDGLIIIIVAFAQSVSIAKLMGLKHGYNVDANQEMFALGVVNVVCAVFSGYICGASVSRTVVQDSAGGKTQIASLFAAALVLLVMLFIGPYFYHVPKIALSAIIIVSLLSLILKLLTIPDMWRKSKVDCAVFVLTVVAVVILDADIGLLVGIVVSIFLVLFQSMRSSVDVTAHIVVSGVNFWRSANKYFMGQEMSSIKVVRINFPLYFVNAEIVTNAIFSKTKLNPLKVAKNLNINIQANGKPCLGQKKKNEVAGNKVKNLTNNVDEEIKGKSNPDATDVDAIHNGAYTPDVEMGHSVDDLKHDRPVTAVATNGSVHETDHGQSKTFTTLILDMSSVSFIDLMGVKALEFLVTKYKAVGVTVYMTNVSENCLDTLQKSGFMGKHGTFVFLTVDTVLQYLALSKRGQSVEQTRL